MRNTYARLFMQNIAKFIAIKKIIVIKLSSWLLTKSSRYLLYLKIYMLIIAKKKIVEKEH
jgi:hypothetical protein